jgi:tetratricopeptide (TPR) repeat protein
MGSAIMVIDWQWTPGKQAGEALINLATEVASGAPDQPANWVSLANLVTLVRGHREALHVLAESIGHCPEAAELRFLAAQAHFAVGEYERGLEECDRALLLSPGHEQAQLLQSSLLVKTTGLDAAKRLLDFADDADLSSSYVLEYLCAHLSEPGVAEEVIERCDRALAKDARSVQPVYFKALALEKLGDTAAAATMLSLDQTLLLSTPETPRGYDEAVFRARLAEEVLNHPSLRDNPRGKSTSGGRQTDPLREDDGPATAALFSLVRRAVESYARGALGFAGPQSGTEPVKCSLQVWATVLGPQGKQDVHRHPDGWLSGVYYVRAPWSEGASRYCGDLIVGIVDENSGIDLPWDVRRIEPVPGRMVIFPSYMPHSTEPSSAAGDRISIAFDVVRSATGEGI